MKKALLSINAVIFSVLFPFFCISSTFEPAMLKYLYGYFGPHGFQFILLRYIIIALLIFAFSYILRENEKLMLYVLPIELLIVTAVIYYDYFIGYHLLYNFSYGLWICASVSVASASLFLANTFYFKGDFKKFYRFFWASYAPIYLLILYISFIRTPGSFGFSLNTKIGSGTIQYFSYLFHHINDGYIALITFGNILVFIPASFIIKNISFKLNDLIILIIGLLLPLGAEAYQYIFKCGDVDIDDLILNWSGFLIGLIIMRLIVRKKNLTEN